MSRLLPPQPATTISLLLIACLAAPALSWRFDEWGGALAAEMTPLTRDLFRRHMTQQEAERTAASKAPEGTSSSSSSSAASTTEHPAVTTVDEEAAKVVEVVEQVLRKIAEKQAKRAHEKKAKKEKSEEKEEEEPRPQPAKKIEKMVAKKPSEKFSQRKKSAAAKPSSPAVEGETSSAKKDGKESSAESTMPTATMTSTASNGLIASLATSRRGASESLDLTSTLPSLASSSPSPLLPSRKTARTFAPLTATPASVSEVESGAAGSESGAGTVGGPSIAPSSVRATTPIAQYRRVSCDMCLKAVSGLNFNVIRLKKVAEDMVTKDCEALLYGDDEAIAACVDVMLRKIEEYYARFEPMMQTNRVCVRLGMCAPQLVTTAVVTPDEYLAYRT